MRSPSCYTLQENEGGKALAEVFKKMGSLEELVMPQAEA
jgi:hypothetical protein